jgi:hypothetical protein
VPFESNWLPGTDSNCRPSGYKCPGISTRLGLSHHPSKIQGLRVSGASPPSLARRVRAEALVSAPSLNSHYFRAWLRITILHWLWRAGFPEFTRFFNHDFSWKLHVLQPPALPTELPGNIPFQISKNMIYASIKIFDFQQPAQNFQHEIGKKYKNLWTPIWLDRKGLCS